MKKSIKLIQLFYQVCDWYNENLAYNIQRFNRNGLKGHITDEELITMYNYMRDYWDSWFILPSYATFNDRLNRLNAVFPDLIALLFKTCFNLLLRNRI